jgi:hypothetical protein
MIRALRVPEETGAEDIEYPAEGVFPVGLPTESSRPSDVTVRRKTWALVASVSGSF